MTNKTIQYVEQSSLKKDVPQFSVGDTVDVHTRIVEGDKERIQVFSGTVIMKRGAGINETFTVRRIVNNEGVERIFPLHSPFISKVIVKRGGETRRAKLFYLRERVGEAPSLRHPPSNTRTLPPPRDTLPRHADARVAHDPVQEGDPQRRPRRPRREHGRTLPPKHGHEDHHAQLSLRPRRDRHHRAG